jgi:hypothetical protein
MSFVSTFPVPPQIVKKDAKHAAAKADADEYWKYLDNPIVVTVEQLEAHALKREADELAEAIWHMSKYSGLDQDVARRSKAEVRNAITKANEAMKDVNNVDDTATNFLREATNSLNEAKELLGTGKPMKRARSTGKPRARSTGNPMKRARGGTLRRKSVKRCKS